jgi:aryl-alcohol dehydrogenase-like predicted oxidoreductase
VEREEWTWNNDGIAGPMVSKFGFGAMMFGRAADEKNSREMLDTYVEAGGTFVDTADIYSQGVSEQWLGSWLKDRPGMRERMVVATKGRFMVDGQPGASLRPAYLRTALEASLRRLGVERIDLYQLHGARRRSPGRCCGGVPLRGCRRRADRLCRREQLPRLAGHEAGQVARRARRSATGLAPGPVQPAGPWGRMGDAALGH